MDISEVTRRSGVPASTLRFYDEIGLVMPTGRQGIRRQYSATVLEQLALIALGRSAGFSLDEIGGMLRTDGCPQIDRQFLSDKAEELDRSVRKLSAMRDGLRHAAACPAPSHIECPTFRRLMGLAASEAVNGQGKKRSPGKRRFNEVR